MSNLIPKFSPEIQAMHEKLSEATLRVVREHQIAIEGLTEKQVAEAFRQAVLAGDFQIHVVAYPAIPDFGERVPIRHPETEALFQARHAQSVIYLPYHEAEELRSEIERLKGILKEHGIDHRPTEPEDY